MSTRERWIVYPILFLTLGIALRDKIIPAELRPLSVDTPAIACGRLDVDDLRCATCTVVGPDGRTCARLRGMPSGAGCLEIAGTGATPVLVAGMDAKGRTGQLELADNEGRLRAQLGSTEAGGFLTLMDPQREIEVVLGHDGEGLSLAGHFRRVGRQAPLTLPCRWRDVLRKMALEK
ncbi:MAG: hypothetical protein JW809_04920 [Pirellulales bacterium]|nr:hypothetical protein [Pirellulales bacterium]